MDSALFLPKQTYPPENNNWKPVINKINHFMLLQVYADFELTGSSGQCKF